MTQSPPPERPPSPRRPLNSDDLIGILVAFASIGGIFFWSISRDNQGFNLALPDLTTTPQATSSPLPWLTGSPDPRPTITAVPARPVEPTAIVPVPPSPQVAPVPVPIPTQPTAQQKQVEFADVTPDYWATPFLTELARRNVIERYPDGTFQPDKPITRAEFASMVNKAFDQPNQKEPIPFGDIPGGFWARGAIDEAVRMGFMNGYPGNVFRPEQVIPKYQALIALATGLGLQEPANPVQTLVFYQDADQLPRYAVTKVAAATNAGLVVNHPEPKQLQPNQNTTRAEAAALIYQALAHSGKATKVDSAYIVPPQP